MAEPAFDALVGAHRREIQAHCYRMLGSLADAEDAVQEALLRAWKGVDGLTDRRVARAWLYKIATNVCLDRLSQRARAGASEAPARADDPPDPCPASLWEATDPGPEARISARESVALAFMAVLRELSPKQRAVLLLRDVMGWSAGDVARMLNQSVASVNSVLQRAHAQLEVPRRPAPRPPDAEGARALLLRYFQAWEARDARALTSLLREAATLTMPPG